jgi:[acyl-carrier-protein] S-malonyltransferase
MGCDAEPGIGFCFPGQGSQHPLMGRELLAFSPAARRCFEEADDVLGDCLSRRIFARDPTALARTLHTQPALLTVSTATALALAECGITPDVVIGHSVGEYAALVCAGALAFADALRLVRARGAMMEESVGPGEGGMCALIGVDVDEAERLCRELGAVHGCLEIVGYNAPGEFAVGGSASAIDALMAQAAAKRIRVLRLATSGPFHTSLLRDASASFASVLTEVRWQRPRIPWVSNIDAAWIREADEIAPRLAAQVSSPVRFEACVRALVAAGVHDLVEVGPGRVLSGLVARIVPAVRIRCTRAGRDRSVFEASDTAGGVPDVSA